MINPIHIRCRLRFLVAVIAVIVVLLTLFTNGAFYMVGTYVLAGVVVVYSILHAVLCRCPHCGRRLSVSGDETCACQYCGGPLRTSHVRETYSGLCHQEQ
ncbi:MAG: hypothetical protein IKU62_03910 [Ruminiclostridium sp.]|nr:hypothetical protein [Ruminiclostridium sp.]